MCGQVANIIILHSFGIVSGGGGGGDGGDVGW